MRSGLKSRNVVTEKLDLKHNSGLHNPRGDSAPRNDLLGHIQRNFQPLPVTSVSEEDQTSIVLDTSSFHEDNVAWDDDALEPLVNTSLRAEEPAVLGRGLPVKKQQHTEQNYHYSGETEEAALQNAEKARITSILQSFRPTFHSNSNSNSNSTNITNNNNNNSSNNSNNSSNNKLPSMAERMAKKQHQQATAPPRMKQTSPPKKTEEEHHAYNTNTKTLKQHSPPRVMFNTEPPIMKSCSPHSSDYDNEDEQNLQQEEEEPQTQQNIPIPERAIYTEQLLYATKESPTKNLNTVPTLHNNVHVTTQGLGVRMLMPAVNTTMGNLWKDLEADNQRLTSVNRDLLKTCGKLETLVSDNIYKIQALELKAVELNVQHSHMSKEQESVVFEKKNLQKALKDQTELLGHTKVHLDSLMKRVNSSEHSSGVLGRDKQTQLLEMAAMAKKNVDQEREKDVLKAKLEKQARYIVDLEAAMAQAKDDVVVLKQSQQNKSKLLTQAVQDRKKLQDALNRIDAFAKSKDVATNVGEGGLRVQRQLLELLQIDHLDSKQASQQEKLVEKLRASEYEDLTSLLNAPGKKTTSKAGILSNANKKFSVTERLRQQEEYIQDQQKTVKTLKEQNADQTHKFRISSEESKKQKQALQKKEHGAVLNSVNINTQSNIQSPVKTRPSKSIHYDTNSYNSEEDNDDDYNNQPIYTEYQEPNNPYTQDYSTEDEEDDLSDNNSYESDDDNYKQQIRQLESDVFGSYPPHQSVYRAEQYQEDQPTLPEQNTSYNNNMSTTNKAIMNTSYNHNNAIMNNASNAVMNTSHTANNAIMNTTTNHNNNSYYENMTHVLNTSNVTSTTPELTAEEAMAKLQESMARLVSSRTHVSTLSSPVKDVQTNTLRTNPFFKPK